MTRFERRPGASGPWFRLSEGGGVLASVGDSRIINYNLSDPSVGRDGHRILGFFLNNYLRNATVLFAHDATKPPIGRAVNLVSDGGYLRGGIEFARREVYAFADTIYQLAFNGFLNATSISWLPRDWKFATEQGRQRGAIDFASVDLLEISVVPVPALPTALIAARSSGIDVAPMVEWAERALDEKLETGMNMSRSALTSIRRAAGAPSVHPSAGLAERAERKARAERISAQVFGGPFRSLGEHLQAVAAAADDTAQPDPRLVRAPAGMSEGSLTGGGFMVAPQWAEPLVAGMYDEATLAPLCDRRETANPLANVKLPAIDETSRADGSRHGGSLAYWDNEADQVTATSLRWKMLEFVPNKLIGLCVITRELMDDTAMLGAHISRAFAAEFSFKLDLAVLAGVAGQPKGILTSPALITVPKETGQPAATVLAENVDKMWSRLPAPSRKRAVWLVNEDVETSLATLGGANPTATSNALYMPAGTGGNPYPLLKGRPVLVVEQASFLGTVGDIVLADFRQYVLIDGGTTPALSVHARFDSDQVTFRFVLRVDGMSTWASPITPFNGSSTRSPFVALASRP